MFRLNKKIKTKSGQEVTPFLVERQKVYCFNNNKKTIIKYLSDFDFAPQQQESKNEITVVSPVMEITDEIYKPEPIKEMPAPEPVEEILAPEPAIEPEILTPEPEPTVIVDLPSGNVMGGIEDEDYI